MAKAYRDLGYPDLAIGDAYKALLLVDEVAEEGEYHEEAVEAANADYLSEKVVRLNIDVGNDVATERDEKVIFWTQNNLSRTAYVRGEFDWCGFLTAY